MAGPDAASPRTPRRAATGVRPTVVTSLQEMLDQERARKQAEVLATRLALLKKQETRLSERTEETQRRVVDLSQRREKNQQRIQEKERSLREMRKVSYHAAVARAHEPDAEEQGSVAPLPPVPLPRLRAETPRTPRLATPCTTQPLPSQAAETETEKHYSVHATAASTLGRSLGGGEDLEATHEAAPPHVEVRRVPTADIVNQAGRFAADSAGRMARTGLAATLRAREESMDSKLGAWGPAGCLLWMSPRRNSQAAPVRDRGQRTERARGTGAASELQPAELVEHLASKEAELQERLRAAKSVQMRADKELEASFRQFSMVQVSARRSIREGGT